MLKFGFHRLSHSDNVTEFKPKLDIKKTCPSPHHLQADEKLEFSTRFIKDCIHKFSIDSALEPESIAPLCKGYIQLVSKQTVPGITTFSILWM